MTRPHEGDAIIGVHADTDPYEREAERGIRKASEHLDDTTAKKAGKDLGDSISKSMGDELEKAGPDLAHAVEKGLEGKRVRWKVKTVVDKDNNVVKRVVEETFQEIEQAFNSAAKPGGLFSRLSEGVSDAIGNAFNVSGRSPLIGLLIPVIGAIVALVAAAIQAVNALVAILATLPALIAGIALQVGVLFLAFHGLGGAIQAAFAAKNARELNEAIKDLAPSAQKFVRELLPLRDFFRQLSKLTQESFFKGLGSIIPQLQKALGPEFITGFTKLATAMGGLFRSLALFFASPEFVEFVQNLFPATMQFLRVFGPGLLELFRGLTMFSTAILPFLNFLGNQFSDALFELGSFLVQTSKDPGFQNWLDSMKTTVIELGKFFGAVVGFVATLLAQLDAAGGNDLIASLTEDLSAFTAFLSTPVGQKALEGLIHAAILLTEAFFGLLAIVVLLFAGVEALAEWIRHTGIPAIGDFFEFIGNKIINFTFIAGKAIFDFFTFVGQKILDLWDLLKRFFNTFIWAPSPVKAFLESMVGEFRGLGGKILSAVANFKDLLFNAGANLLNGLISGIKSRFGGLSSIIENAAQVVRDFWPFSPAKMGPLSGSGDPMIAGQKTMQRFAEGIKMQIPDLRSVSNEATSNIVFGRDAVRVTFEGALPTQEQAQQTGSAVGAGINGQLAARNTRLAVRTL